MRESSIPEARELLARVGEADPDQARRSVQLFTPREVLSRFGSPTEVSAAQDGGMNWTYLKEDGEHGSRADFRFTGGLVTDLHTKSW